MASRAFDRMHVLGRGRVLLNGSFQPNGASTSVLGVKGNGFVVTHTAGGNLYTVTLQDTYFDYDYIAVDIQGPTVQYTTQLMAEPDVKVAKTLILGLFQNGTATTDIAFNANLRVHFQMMLKNTSGNF